VSHWEGIIFGLIMLLVFGAELLLMAWARSRGMQ
jgi:hypothetical protein